MGEEKILRDTNGKDIKNGDRVSLTDPTLTSIYRLGIPKANGTISYIGNRCFMNNTEVFLTDLLKIINEL